MTKFCWAVDLPTLYVNWDSLALISKVKISRCIRNDVIDAPVFKKKFGGHMSFLGATSTLFWISGDVSF